MIEKYRHQADGKRVILVLLALFPIFAFVYAAMMSTAPEEVLNSDLVQPYMIMRDFVADPSSILSWHLSPAIYVFPDYFIALIINLFQIGPLFSMIANGAVLGVSLTLAGGFLLHVAGFADLARACLVIAVAMFAAILLGLALPGALATNMHIWMFTTFIHSGALLSGMAMIGLWVRAEIAAPFNQRFYIASLVLAVLSSYSDVTFLVYFIIPLSIATGVAWLAQPSAGRFVRTVAMIIIAVAGYMIDRLLRGNHIPGQRFDIAQNIVAWWALVGPYFPGNPLLTVYFLCAPLMLVRALYLTIRALRQRELSSADFAEISLAGTQALSILVPMFVGLSVHIWGQFGNLRYSLPIALLPLLWILILARSWLALPHFIPRLWGAAAWGAACIVSVWAALAAFPTLSAPTPVATCMNALGLRSAYADYWNAKGPVFLSDYRLDIVQLDGNARRYGWNSNDRWFTQSVVDGTPISFNAIITQRLDENVLEKTFGPASQIKICRGLSFWIYDHPLPLPQH